MSSTKEYNRKYHQEHKEQAQRYKQAHKEEINLYIQEHREDFNQWNKEYRERMKFAVLTHYSIADHPMCTRCGVDDINILNIDHINGGGNAQRRSLGLTSSAEFYRWLKTNGYPLGFQVLCRFCNKRKQIENGELRKPGVKVKI